MSNRTPTSILERMVCPVCREPLRENPDRSTVCGNLHMMPFRDGYLDATETAAENPYSVVDRVVAAREDTGRHVLLQSK